MIRTAVQVRAANLLRLRAPPLGPRSSLPPFASPGPPPAMLGAVGRLLGFGSAASACDGCDPAVLAQCSTPQPGDVKAHSHHVFVKLVAPSGSDAGTTDEAWWPESVDA